MNKKWIICMALACTSVISGCKDKNDAFVGHWKAISRADGKAIHKNMSSSLNIECSENTCHVESRNKTLLSDDVIVNNNDWEVKNETTLMYANGLASMYIKSGKLITENYIYVKQPE